MHVELHETYRTSPDGNKAQELISACVHCGFCLATCPTYLDGRDERDSPRGRIYLIKELLESGQASDNTRTHLDRCLTCRSCETTCPSGVQYGSLIDIGRDLIETQAPRAPVERLLRSGLRNLISRPALFGFLLRVGQGFRPLLPRLLRAKIPPRQSILPAPSPAQTHSRTMLLLDGCVQKSATPNTNAAARQVFASLGITLHSAPDQGCCGAVNQHLSGQQAALDNMRSNIDAWWPAITAGAEAIVSSASGCGAMIADYAQHLRDDPNYAAKAETISAMSRDITEALCAEPVETLSCHTDVGAVAVHTPCTLYHALGNPTGITELLERTGFTLARTKDEHLCCGSAGTYSLLQADIAGRLLDNKVEALNLDTPAVIATGNIGCQLNLSGGTETLVVHWIELLANTAAKTP